MKTIRLLAFSVALCAVVACSDDDLEVVPVNGVNPEYAGTYNLTRVMIFAENDFNMDGTANNDMMLESPCYGGSSIILHEDGSYDYYDNNVFLESETGCSSDILGGTWEIDGSDILMTDTTVDVPLTKEHDFNGTEIIMVQNNGTYPVRDEQNNAIYTSGVVTYTFTKS